MTPAVQTASISTPASSSRRAEARRGAREFVAYFGASAAALALDTALYRGGLALGLPLAWAAGLGFVAGLVLVYALCTRLVFSQHRIGNRSLEFTLFAGIGLAGLLLTEALLWVTVMQWHWPAVPAKLATAGAVFVFNFTARKLVLFTQAAPKSRA